MLGTFPNAFSQGLFVSNKRQNSWTDRAQIFVGPHWPQGRFMNHQNFKNLCFKVVIFVKFLKCAKKYYEIRKLFLVCFRFFVLFKSRIYRSCSIKKCIYWKFFYLICRKKKTQGLYQHALEKFQFKALDLSLSISCI